MAHNTVSLSNAVDSQLILDSLLETYSPGITTKNDLDSLKQISRTLTGDLCFFAVDPPVPKIREITRNIINSEATIFIFLHVSERWCYNNYDDIIRPTTPLEDLSFPALLQVHKKIASEIDEYLVSLAQLTDALCSKVAQWEHIFLVLPLEACTTFGRRFLSGTGELHTPHLKTFCFAITPPFLVPDDVRYNTSTREDLSLIREVLIAVLDASESQPTLQNLFFEFTPSHKMLRQPSTSDFYSGEDILRTSLLPDPLRNLSKSHSLRYIQITSPSPPVNVYRLLGLSKDRLQHLVVPVSYGPLIFNNYEQQGELSLPKLKILKMTLLQSTQEDDLSTALSLLDLTVLPQLTEMVMTWPGLLFDQNISDVIGAAQIQRSLEGAVRGGMAECSLKIEHFSEAVVNDLRQSLTGWSRVEVNLLD